MNPLLVRHPCRRCADETLHGKGGACIHCGTRPDQSSGYRQYTIKQSMAYIATNKKRKRS